MANGITVKFIDSLFDCPKIDWQNLLTNTGIDYPFIQYDFLAALERSGSCSKKTGWLTKHLLVFEQDKLIALMPCYEKSHSYGYFLKTTIA